MTHAITSAADAPPAVKPAPLWRRLAAMVYDSFLIIGLSFVYGALAMAIKHGLTGDGDLTQGFYAGLFQLGLLVLVTGFFVYFWQRGGQTLGMRAWHLQLVDQQGHLPSLKQMLARCALAPLSLLVAGVGYWWCLFDRENLTIHDHLTHSLIVVLPKPAKTSAQ